MEVWSSCRKKKLNQWFFKITKFSEELLDELDKLRRMAKQSKNYAKELDWQIFCCEIDFKIEGNKEIDKIKCFTTRPDIYGFSFFGNICRSSNI